jgi:hypothetical protein
VNAQIPNSESYGLDFAEKFAAFRPTGRNRLKMFLAYGHKIAKRCNGRYPGGELAEGGAVL